MQLLNSETRERLAAFHPEAGDELDRLGDVLDHSSIDPALLDLCKDFFETSLRGDTWTPSESLTELQQDLISVCEQFMVSVSDMQSAQVEALGRHMPADDLYNLMYAIYLIDGSQRLKLVLKGVLQ